MIETANSSSLTSLYSQWWYILFGYLVIKINKQLFLKLVNL